MPVQSLDHVNVRSLDPAKTIAFFRDVLQMKVAGPGGRPLSDRAAWVYDENGVPVVHIGAAEMAYPTDKDWPFEAADGSGAIHHVALRCTAFEQMRDRLAALKLEFHENHIPQTGLRQIFVREPSDIMFELNFTGD